MSVLHLVDVTMIYRKSINDLLQQRMHGVTAQDRLSLKGDKDWHQLAPQIEGEPLATSTFGLGL